MYKKHTGFTELELENHFGYLEPPVYHEVPHVRDIYLY